MIRTGIVPAILAACLLVPFVAQAAGPNDRLATQTNFNIPAQSLGAALKQLAQQAGVQILFEERVVDGLQAPAVRVHESAAQALQSLLNNTGLEYTASGETVAVRRKLSSTAVLPTPVPYQVAYEGTLVAQAQGAVPGTPTSSSGRSQPPEEAVKSPPAAETGVNQLREIVVTGSRVITNGDDSPTPVTTVTSEELMTERPGNVADALYDLPAFTQTRNQTTNPGAGGGGSANSAANNAINTMNMRALGSSRTLVLYNGLRLPAVSPEGYTDVNLIPQMLLKRVETVTGGASAVYGSDAIGGVVNFVSDQTFNGIKGEIRGGRSTYGDDNILAGGLAFGARLFDGRGHFMASYNSSNDPGIDSRLSRPWGLRVPTVQGDGLARPFYILLDARSNDYSFGGKINSVTGTSSLNSNMQFVSSGGFPVAFDPGLRGTANGIYRPEHQLGGDGGIQNSTLKSKLNLQSFSGRFDYDVTDTLHAFVDASGLYAFSSQALGYATLSQSTGFSGQNAFLASNYRFNGSFTLGKFMTGMPRQMTESYLHENYFLAGVTGSFGSGYKWSASANTGSGKQNTRWLNHFNNQKLTAALDVVLDASGRPACYAATQAATAAAYADCIPLNAFGVNSESAAAINYVSTTIQDELTNISKGVSANIAGAPFDNWAGPINMAVSAEWRNNTYREFSDSPTADRGGRANCAGLRTFGGTQCGASTTLYQVAVADRPEVGQTVSEAAVEADVPLLKQARLAKSLSTNLAARYARYSNTDGSSSRPQFGATTWKVGVVWDLVNAVTLRATRSRDFRAPNLDELYRPITTGVNVGPTVTNFNLPVAPGGAQTLTGGNDRLSPEKADATTLGVVYRVTPSWSFALDGFRFKVKDAIFFLNGTGNGIAAPCIANPSLALCDFLQRNSAGQVTVIKTGNVNAAGMETYGVDFETNWRTSLGSHPLSARVLVSWQPHFFYDMPGTPRLDEAGVAASFGQAAAGGRLRATAILNLKPTDSLGVTVTERWRSRLSLTDTYGFTSEAVASVAYTNLNIVYSPTTNMNQLEFFLNIQNLLNKQSPYSHPGPGVAPGTFGGVAPGDDVIGRYYAAGMRFRL